MKNNERFEQTFSNYKRALSALKVSIDTPIQEARDLSGIIKDFEMCYELGWKLLKHYLELSGHETKTARDVFMTAYQLKIITDEDVWLKMIGDRNETVHVYNEKLARQMVDRIHKNYYIKLSELVKAVET